MGEIFEKLGITWQSMLFHFIAIIVLIAALTYLLYKPMKRIIQNHNQRLKDVYGENEKLNSEALEIKQNYEGMMDEVRQESMKVSAEALDKARVRAENIIDDAENTAKNILDTAKDEAKQTRDRLNNEFKATVGKMAVDIAGKVLMREVSEKDNADIIDACLMEWDKA